VLEGRSKPKLGPGKAAPTAETKGIYTEDHKGHKGAWLAIVDAVNWSTSDGPLDTRKGNSETFVIFAAFCANSAAPGRSIFRIRRFGWEFFVLDGELAFSLVHGQR
jgi:hypothetical protein